MEGALAAIQETCTGTKKATIEKNPKEVLTNCWHRTTLSEGHHIPKRFHAGFLKRDRPVLQHRTIIKLRPNPIMKKRPLHRNPRARVVACTVSAAALMLGVSEAATVGINFQANYCGAPSLSGYIVTTQAFGIGTNGWQNLTQMDTG